MTLAGEDWTSEARNLCGLRLWIVVSLDSVFGLTVLLRVNLIRLGVSRRWRTASLALVLSYLVRLGNRLLKLQTIVQGCVAPLPLVLPWGNWSRTQSFGCLCSWCLVVWLSSVLSWLARGLRLVILLGEVIGKRLHSVRVFG